MMHPPRIKVYEVFDAIEASPYAWYVLQNKKILKVFDVTKISPWMWYICLGQKWWDASSRTKKHWNGERIALSGFF